MAEITAKGMAYNHGYEHGYAQGKKDAEADLVRCKDCKHYESCEGGKDFCCWHATGIVPDDFCSYGERKDGDGNG